MSDEDQSLVERYSKQVLAEERLAAAAPDLLAALKDIRGVGHGPTLERANDKLDQVMEWAQEAIDKAEGK